jgi:DNA-directed RNA polymerase subunit F
MARDYTPHQQRIIRNYYRNLDQIHAERLQELVGEIWLATGEKKRERLWARVAELLAKGSTPPAEVRRVLETRDVEALARLIQ